MTVISHSRLLEVLAYDPGTGEFRRKISTAHRVTPGDVAGCVTRSGYVVIRIDNELFQAHRLAWFYVYGMWPTDDLDHINRQKSDNRLANLREVDARENAANTELFRNNTSGFRGVTYHKDRSKWVAQIKKNSRTKYIGIFSTKEAAYSAYLDEAKRHFGAAFVNE